MDSARAEAAAGNLAGAAASLERALRIEPRNPRLWHELARVRLKQGQHAQAESVAARSNSWAGEDKALRAENWRLIAESRRARGDADGAQAALEQAEPIAQMKSRSGRQRGCVSSGVLTGCELQARGSRRRFNPRLLSSNLLTSYWRWFI